jgi:hypothetical protein
MIWFDLRSGGLWSRGPSMRVVPVCLVSSLLVALLGAPADADASSVLLDVGLVSRADASAVLSSLGDSVLSSGGVFNLSAITVEVPGDRADAVVAELKADPRVRYAEADPAVSADGDTTGAANPALLTINQIPGAWTWSTGSPAITVAVVDTGVTPTADLGTDRLLPGYDAIDLDHDATDDDGHGTLVAGIAANVCGQCRILPVRALHHDLDGGRATGHAADLASGITWASAYGANVINVSASTPINAGVLKDALTRANTDGSLVVASAGHDPGHAAYPAAMTSALAVGSVSATGQPDSGSPTGNGWVDVAAVDGLSAIGPDSKAHVLTGTSASTAVVSGTAALGWAVSSVPRSAVVRTALTMTARRLDPVSSDPPLLDAAKMLFQMGGTDAIPPTVTASGLPDTVGPAPMAITPTIIEDHAIEHVDLVYLDTVERWWPGLPPPRLQAKAGDDYATVVLIRAYDYAGRLGETYKQVYFDGTAPTGMFGPPTPAAGAHVRGAASIIFSSPDGDNLVSVKLNGVAMAHVPGSGLWTRTAAPTSTGLYRVDFTDAGGNSSSIGRQVVVDNAGPTATSLSPAANAHVRGTFTAGIGGVADPSGVASAQLWANGSYVGIDKSTPYAMAVRTGSRSGAVTLSWRLTDKLGNVRSYTRTIIADNAAPILKITKAPGNKAKVKGTVTVYASASDSSGVAKVQLLVNGKVVATDTKAGYTLRVNTKKTARTMKVQVRAYDKLGNVRSTSTRVWYRR